MWACLYVLHITVTLLVVGGWGGGGGLCTHDSVLARKVGKGGVESKASTTQLTLDSTYNLG